MERFDHVEFDEESIIYQKRFKANCMAIETGLVEFNECRAKSLALIKLDELYMWINKAIRDDQIERNG